MPALGAATGMPETQPEGMSNKFTFHRHLQTLSGGRLWRSLTRLPDLRQGPLLTAGLPAETAFPLFNFPESIRPVS